MRSRMSRGQINDRHFASIAGIVERGVQTRLLVEVPSADDLARRHTEEDVM